LRALKHRQAAVDGNDSRPRKRCCEFGAAFTGRRAEIDDAIRIELNELQALQ